MANDQVYAHGLLNQALDPSTQPTAIREFLRSEQRLIEELVPRGAKVIDLGCGTGRHLLAMAGRISQGVGVDYERRYVKEANRLRPRGALHFLVADATAVPFDTTFDMALCLTNTWGTMSDKLGVLNEMRRLAPSEGTRLITVYSPASVASRLEWYANLGHEVLEVTDQHLATRGGFVSEHFSQLRVRQLVGPCRFHPICEIAYVVQV